MDALQQLTPQLRTTALARWLLATGLLAACSQVPERRQPLEPQPSAASADDEAAAPSATRTLDARASDDHASAARAPDDSASAARAQRERCTSAARAPDDSASAARAPDDHASAARDADDNASAARAADDDAPRPTCGPDGERSDPLPLPQDDTADCPADKNLEGCPCPSAGETAACWPAQRVHRHYGQCQDGQTTCRDRGADGAVWGPCEGAVLPTPGATAGPAACRCFSSGHWTLRNLVPCVYGAPDGTYLTSSIEDARTGFRCEPRVRSEDDTAQRPDWTTSLLTAECAGQFELCFTLKAGDAAEPRPDDCTLQHLCIDTWYPRPGATLELPSLPGWQSEPDPCTRQFVEEGGYGELSVLGTSADCDAVDDGHGAPYVFKRTRYCSTQCALTPGRPECKACDTGVSGQF